MADVSDFLKAQKKANNAVQHQELRFRRALDAALLTTQSAGEKYVDLSKLENDADRATFNTTLTTGLTADYQAAITAMPDDPVIGQALVMDGAYGFNPMQVSGIVDQLKDKLTYDGFMQAIAKNTRWQDTLQTRMSSAAPVLEDISGTKVANYAGILAPNASKMTLQDKAELIGTFDQLGVIPPKMLKDKPYI